MIDLLAHSFIILLFSSIISPIPSVSARTILDNAIIGQPYISCERERIVIEVVTERLFTGKVFVKGDYANAQCTRTFRNGASINSEMVVEKGGEEEGEVDPFLGTVTRSREPYTDQDRSEIEREELAKIRATERLQEQDRHRIAEAHIAAPPDLSRRHQNLTTPSAKPTAQKYGDGDEEDDGEQWSSAGGASPDYHVAFGGSRGEEENIQATTTPVNPYLKIFEKDKAAGSSTFEADKRKRLNSPLASSSNNNNCPTSTCEPCQCPSSSAAATPDDERRSRRATNSIRLEVPLHECNAKRDRKLNPPSVIVSFIAVVSFHDSFITKLDKAYHIQCSYAETDKTVSTDIDVNMNEETELTETIEPPTCEYLISNEKGSAVRNSLVGELVSHKWVCRGGLTEKRRILVHDCFVEDGSGQNFQVIDDHGCSLDRIMLQTPTYSEDGLSAQVDAYVFKFPDRSTVDFRCSITFCSLDDAECKELTPPNCSSSEQLIEKKRRRKRQSSSKMPLLSLHANSMTVFDVDSNESSESIPTPSQSPLSIEHVPTSFCISVASFGILISASTFFATISFAVIFAYIFIRFNSKLTLE